MIDVVFILVMEEASLEVEIHINIKDFEVV